MTVCSCAENYWILDSGDNMLKGCECDPCNPIMLQDCYIVYALRHSEKARKDFCLLWESLWPCEKERFILLFKENPAYWPLIKDYIDDADSFQKKLNDIPVYTSGPKAGFRNGRLRGVGLPPTVL